MLLLMYATAIHRRIYSLVQQLLLALGSVCVKVLVLPLARAIQLPVNHLQVPSVIRIWHVGLKT